MARFRRGLSVALFSCALLSSSDALAAPSDRDSTFGGGDGFATIKPGDPFSESRDAVLQADGRIAMVGIRGGSSPAWALARLTSSGAPDPDFDGDGKKTLQFSGGGAASAVAQQADGKLIVAGTAGSSNFDTAPFIPDFVVARLNSDGSFDESFGDGGVARTPLAGGVGWVATPKAIAVQPDGKIVVAGSSPEGGVHVTLVRYTSGGDEDPTFDGDGIVHAPTGNGSEAEAVLLDPAGRILIAGYGPDAAGDRVALLARFTSTGGLDSTFDGDGLVHADWHEGEDIESAARGLVRQPDGKLVAGGMTQENGTPVFAIARFLDTGAPDASFGESGLTRTDVGFGEAHGLERAPGGKLLLAGEGNGKQVLARYDADGHPDTGFGSNGVVSETTGGWATDVLVQPLDGRIVLTGFAGGEFSATRLVGDPPPPDDGNGDPGGTDGPGEDDSEGCEHELRRFTLIARAACFRTNGDWKTSDALVRINGLDLVPVDGTVIKLDPDDFRLRTEAPGGGVGLVDVRAGNVTLARTGFDLGLGTALVFRSADSATIDGFRITGDVTVAFTGEGVATLDATITSALINGALKGRMEMDGSLIGDSLAIEMPGFVFGAVAATQPLRLNFAPSARNWSGSGGFRLGRGTGFLDFTGRMVIADGRWREVTGSAGLIPMGVLPVRNVTFSMRDVGGSLQIAGSAGLPINSLGGLESFKLDGALSATVPLTQATLPLFAWRLRGTARLFDTAALVNGELRFGDSQPSFTGRAEWGLKAGQFSNLGAGGAGAANMDASVSAAVRYANFQASGSGTARIFGLGINVDMSYGSRGIGACGNVRVGVGPLSTVVRGGATVRFHPTRYSALVGACDIAALSSASAAAAGNRPVRLPGGRRAGVLVVRGAGAPPRVRVQGPGGARLSMARGAKPQKSGRFLVLKEQSRDTTYVLVAKPRGGRWAVRPLPGSAKIRSVTPAAALPPIKVTGKVTRAKGGRRVLRWHGKGVAGHVLRFREVGSGVNRLLGTGRKGRGRLRFKPAAGAKAARRIIALAERGGVPRATLRVARFKP